MSEIVYKFMCPDRTQYFDTELMRFTQPHLLNDPFELMPTISHEDMRQLIEKSLTSQKIEFRQKHSADTNLSEDQKIKLEILLTSSINKIRSDHTMNPDRMREVFYKDFVREKFDGICLWSLSKRWNSSLMWAHYALNHQGFCIGFDRSHPFFTEGDLDQDRDRLREVIYQKDRVQIKLNSELDNREVFFTKNEDWKYERELRMLRFTHQADQKVSDDIFLFKVPHSLVKEVLIGKNCSIETEHLVKQFASKLGIDCFCTFPSFDNFDMCRKVL